MGNLAINLNKQLFVQTNQRLSSFCVLDGQKKIGKPTKIDCNTDQRVKVIPFEPSNNAPNTNFRIIWSGTDFVFIFSHYKQLALIHFIKLVFELFLSFRLLLREGFTNHKQL
jgi:hypothetical protein